MAQDIEQDDRGFYSLCVWNAVDKTDEEVCMKCRYTIKKILKRFIALECTNKHYIR